MLFVIFAVSKLSAQVCVPNSTLLENQVDPDSDNSQTFVDGTINVPYDDTYSIHVPTIFDVLGNPINVVSIKFMGIQGLPPGLTAMPNPVDSLWPFGTIGCVKISGTPTSSGVFTLSLKQELDLGFTVLPLDNNAYTLNITAPVGIVNNARQNISLQNVEKNENNMVLTIYSPENEEVRISLLSVAGVRVIDISEKLESGHNNIAFETQGLSKGVYIISISTPERSINNKILF